jgi:UDP-N-acetylglucosamine--N-acetylmuramyl-(pentapeptide) pyrophosphoryl-undecaprenol N-acetylglucosamine transferase
VIGYYVHHHGLGHLTRARSIAAACGLPITVLSSLAPGPGPFAGWVELPRDDRPDDAGEDRDASGALHWAPRGSSGYTARMARLAAWVDEARPSALVVDASVEVTLLGRLLGLPVVVMAAPGVRDDRPHRLAHRVATRIVAPWTAAVMDPPHLRPWADRTVHCGAVSRFDGRRAPTRAPGGREVLVVVGAGGSALGPADVDAARRATPGWTWRTLGVDGWAGGDDVWAALAGADVVVCHGGQNVLAEVAAARRPAVVVPQERPFGEQHTTAAALAAAGIAVAAPDAPAPDRWPALLERARALGGEGWARWSHGDGARRAAAVITGLVAEPGRAGRDAA